MKIFGIIPMYAICILTGIIVAYIAGVREGKRLGLNKNFILNGVLLVVPVAIIGARLWYVLFNPDSFKDFAEVCGFSNGKFTGLQGLAIQGGLIASLITIFIYCRYNKVSLFKVLDIVAPGFLIGQIFGRYGNFFNQELYGPVIENTDAFKIILPSFITENMLIDRNYRHPAFLYESCLNFIGLCIILVIRRKSNKLKSGDLMGFYLIWYGVVRIITESVRLRSGVNDPLMLGNIPVSILISVLGIITGSVFLVLKRTLKQLDSPYYSDILKDVNNKKIDTIIFDLDGTLLDTKKLIHSSFIYTFNKFFPDLTLSDEELDSFFGPTLYDSFSKYTKDEKLINEMIDYYRVYNKEHHDEFVKAFEGAKTTLRTLHFKGYIICVVSSKIKEMVEYGLLSQGLLKYVDFIIGEGQTKAKPNPEGILLAMDHFKFSKNGIYIGDNPSDIYAGINANKYYIEKNINKSMVTCAVAYSNKFDEIKDVATYTISDLEDLLDVVNA